jgi:hypothetical protein
MVLLFHARFFEAAVSAHQICFHQIIRRFAIAGEHGRLGGTFDDEFKRAGGKFRRTPDVACDKFNSRRLQSRQIQFRTTSV